MITFNIEPLHKFISSNKLKNNNDIILFNATIEFYKNESLHNIHSQVLIVMLPKQIAVYILEFLKEEFHTTELYNTSSYHFKCPEAKRLEIYQNNADQAFILSIIPL
jgi:hypothetical protein